MKKYISLLLATAATIACTKVALEDNCPIESLPQDGNTENVQGEPSGEKIIISLAETKVSLDGNGYYQFDGDEVIYVKARTTGAVAKLHKSADKSNTFTGVFNGLLGDTSETFDFYYNCTDEKGNVVKVQNGQPWLAATGVKGDRDRSTASEYSYKLNNVMLKQLDRYVCLALNSEYPCTVDFHTLTTALPNGEKTISGIQFGSGNNKPYFVNIVSGMEGGFYLTVTNPKGQKMYTSYGTTAKISSNKIIKTKETFEAFSITGEVDTDSSRSFMSTYDLYCNSQIDKANSTNSNILSSGIVNFPVTGISKSLLTFKSIKIIFSDGVEVSATEAVEWVNKTLKTLKVTIPSTSDHNIFGEVKINSVTAYFSTPDNDNVEVTANASSFVRYITGLPYNACPTQDTWEYSNIADWHTSSTYGGGLMYNSNGYIKKSFYIPQGGINATVSHSGYGRKGSVSLAGQTTFNFYVGDKLIYTERATSTSSPGQKLNYTKEVTLNTSNNFIKCTSTHRYLLSTYATTNNITVHYR